MALGGVFVLSPEADQQTLKGGEVMKINTLRMLAVMALVAGLMSFGVRRRRRPHPRVRLP